MFDLSDGGTVVVSKSAGADGYEAILVGAKPAKGEHAAVVPYLEPDELLLLRQPAELVGETDSRVLQQGAIVVVVTDRKVIVANTSGGFRPRWEVFTLPYGHLDPGVLAGGTRGTDVTIPTSGRRTYRVQLTDSDSAARLAGSLGDALRAYRRDRMGLEDA
ncbi:MAG: hypothetical protein ABWZ02_01435 [Nakamurella sp.]